MQEEVNEKTISLCIKGGKITAQILKAALIKLLAEMDKKKQRGKGEKSQCKKTGRQSIKSLQKSGAQITNIVVTDNNIKSFDRVARKYGIDYSLKKVEQEGKTEYLVFFKAKDVDVMTAAFKEYTSETLKKQKRESVRQKLEVAYAVSIHKAQGLEYDSVKIIISNEIEEQITHNIFYTAITRAKKKLKIYWSPETEKSVITRFKKKDNYKDAYLLSQIKKITLNNK